MWEPVGFCSSRKHDSLAIILKEFLCLSLGLFCLKQFASSSLLTTLLSSFTLSGEQSGVCHSAGVIVLKDLSVGNKCTMRKQVN
ncbi:hypothetical protein FKM82_027900 [Ascaphus truei]